MCRHRLRKDGERTGRERSSAGEERRTNIRRKGERQGRMANDQCTGGS